MFRLIPRLSPPFDWSDIHQALIGLFRDDGVTCFEEEAARRLGVAGTVYFPYGRSGFLALIEVMGWRGREIILPAYTCVVMPNVILHSGARPRFVDIDSRDYNMRPDLVGQVVNKQTAAVVATHIYGFPMDLDGLDDALSGREDLVIIQDCALAYGTAYKGRPVWKRGQASLFSLSIGKHISTVEGGLISSDDPDLLATLRQWRDDRFQPASCGHSLSQLAFLTASWLGLNPWLYPLAYHLAYKTSLIDFLTVHHDERELILPRNLTERQPSFLGRLGVNQFNKLNDVIQARLDLARRFREVLTECEGVELPDPRSGATYSHFPCLVDEPGRMLRFMLDKGIHLGREVFDYVIPDMPLYKPFSEGDYTASRRTASQLVLIPNHYRLAARDADRIIRALDDWRRETGR